MENTQADDISLAKHCANLIGQLWNSQNELKLSKKVIKSLMEVESKNEDILRACLGDKIRLEDLKSNNQLFSIYSQLIESSSVARDLLAPQIAAFFIILSEGLQKLMLQETHRTPGNQALLNTHCKIVLQITQHLSTVIKDALWPGDNRKTAESQALSQCLNCLYNMLYEARAPKDSLMLIGTTFAYVLRRCEDTYYSLSLLDQLLKGLAAQVPSEICIGNVVLKANATNSQLHTPYLGSMCLLNGFLSCAPQETLVAENRNQEFDGFGGHTCPQAKYAMECFFTALLTMCSDEQYQFLAFKTLQLWSQKLSKCLSVNHINIDVSANSLIIKGTLSLVWTHIGSPTDGVAMVMLDIFKIMVNLAVDYECKQHGESRGFLDHLMQEVMAMSWQVKGKHLLCSVLLEFINIDEWLSQYPGVTGQLLECMSAHYMTPGATAMFQAIYTACRDKTKLNEMCLTWLAKGLAIEDSCTCYNVCHFWLPWTLRVHPGCLAALLTSVRGVASGQTALRAQIAVYRSARALNTLQLTDLSEAVLVEAALHPDDELRLDALALLCESARKAEPLCETELRVLQTALPYLLNTDSPSFRQQFQAHLRTAVVRARDGACALLRTVSGRAHNKTRNTVQGAESREGQEKRLLQQIDFLDWLWGLCIENLSPGASFQRLKTCLEWVWVTLESLVYQPQRTVRKGGCPPQAVQMLEFAHARERLRLFSTQSCHALLACLLSGSDEIREFSSRVLTQFFPWPLPLSPNPASTPSIQHSEQQTAPAAAPSVQHTEQQTATSVLRKALILCACPKAHDADGGVKLCKLILQKYVLDCGWHFRHDEACAQGVSLVTSAGPQGADLNTRVYDFLHMLLCCVERSVRVAEENLLLAARESPAHGLIVAVRNCLEVCTLPADSARWRELLCRLLAQSAKLVDMALLVLGGKVHDEDSAPSFEQMGTAIQQVLTECGGKQQTTGAKSRGEQDWKGSEWGEGWEGEEDGEEQEQEEKREDTALSAGHQLLMSWAWINIRETSLLHGSVAAHAPSLLAVSEVTRLGALFHRVLTRCRHRGAIEGCQLGFSAYCSALLGKAQSELYEIPGEMLRKVLVELREGGGAASVTRRSAGLPLLITGIVTSENRLKQTTLLEEAVCSLLAIAGSPLPSSPDQRRDLPHVHALNVLKALFSSLTNLLDEAVCSLLSIAASPLPSSPDQRRNLPHVHALNVLKALTYLLEEAVCSLLSIAASPLPSSPDQRRDLPHVHALNVLKALFREASLATALGRHLEPACLLTIAGFASPVWVLRNAATQLFSTLLNRMLGQKAKDDSLHSTTATELFTRFPALRATLLEHLQAAKQEAHGRMRLHPCLFPVLAILSKLSAGVTSERTSALAGFLEPVLALAGSAIYVVREMAARALVALVGAAETPGFVVRLAESLPRERSLCYSFNALHGTLLQIEALLDSTELSPAAAAELAARLPGNSWLGNSSLNPCVLVLGLYLRVRATVFEARQDLLELQAQALLDPALEKEGVKIGESFYAGILIAQWLSSCPSTAVLCSRVDACLRSGNHEAASACLLYLQRALQSGRLAPEGCIVLHAHLLQHLSYSNRHCKLQCDLLRTLCNLYHAMGNTETPPSTAKTDPRESCASTKPSALMGASKLETSDESTNTIPSSDKKDSGEFMKTCSPDNAGAASKKSTKIPSSNNADVPAPQPDNVEKESKGSIKNSASDYTDVTKAQWEEVCGCGAGGVAAGGAADVATGVLCELTRAVLERPQTETAALAIPVIIVLNAATGRFSQRLVDWVVVVQLGSGAEQTESLRQHTALALRLRGAPLVQTLLDERTTHRELLALSVLESCVRLLVDEQIEARKYAAMFVAQLPWIPRWQVRGALHPNYALLLLLKHVVGEQLAAESPVCRRKLARWISRGADSLAEVIQQEATAQVDELFECLDVNPYREHVILDSLVVLTLQPHLAASSGDCYSSDDAETVVAELEQAIPLLRRSCQEHSAMNVSCVDRCYVRLHSLLCQLQLLMTGTDPKDQLPARSINCLNQLLQIPFVHPHVVTTAERILKEAKQLH